MIDTLAIARERGASQNGYMRKSVGKATRPRRNRDEGPPLSRLMEIRRARGLRMAELARLLKIDDSHVQKLEDRDSVPKNFVVRLSEALHLSADDLFAPIGAPIPAVPPDQSGVDANSESELANEAEQIRVLSHAWPRIDPSIREAVLKIAIALTRPDAA